MQSSVSETIDHVMALPGPSLGFAPGFVPGMAPDGQWGDILRAWLRYSWLIGLVAVLGTILGYAGSQTMETVYESDAALLLDRPSAGKLDNAADRTEYSSDQRAAMVRSQIEILRGSYVVDDVIEKLHLADVPMFNPRPGAFDFLRGWMQDAMNALWPAGPVAAQPPVSREALVSGIYLNHLSIEQSPDTYVVHVTFRGSDPVLAARIVNAHVASYIAWQRTERATAVQGNETWLASEVEAARGRVIAAEAAVREFNGEGVLLTVDGRTALDQGLAQLTTDLAVSQANLVKAEARAAEVKRLQAAHAVAGIVSMSGSRVLDALQTAHAQALADAASVTASYGPGHPETYRALMRSAEIKAAVDDETAHYVESIEAEANIARATVVNLQAALDRTRGQVVAAESDRSRLSRLEGEATTERNIYLSLLQKLRSFDGVTKLVQPEVTVLSPAAVPVLPRSPRPVLLALFGGLVAAGAAAGGIVWAQGRRGVVRHTQDAASLTGVRCLAIMPLLRHRRGAVDRGHPDYSFFGEELRGLCAALVRDRGGEGGGSKAVSLLVTSCLPDEGKTTFCHELGRFVAGSGVRTLVVRADERSRGNGADEVAQVDPALPLFAVDWTVPATMLGSQELVRSIEGWRREFGLVVFDTPPTTAMAESLVLAPLADATVVLARVDRTPRSLLTGVTLQIANAGGRLAGIVLTFVRLDTQRGVMPSDAAYWFSRNRGYHHRQVAAHPAPRV